MFDTRYTWLHIRRTRTINIKIHQVTRLEYREIDISDNNILSRFNERRLNSDDLTRNQKKF